jgi:CDP-diacylglycerol---glycerol-3-phosphate 3-phosphatidyltransferase
MFNPESAEERVSSVASLRREWLFFLFASLLFLAGGYALLYASWQLVYAALWLILPSVNTAYLLVVLWRNLDSNKRQDEERLLPTLGLGNVLSLARGLLVAVMLGFLFLPRPAGWLAWLPGILYALSVAADFFDGYAARLSDHVTRLGEILDMSLDGVGVLGASLLAVQYGQAPGWYILVGLARYLFLAGLWLRRKLGQPTYEMPPSLSRRVFAGLQMGFLAAILWPLFSPPATTIAATLFGLPFLAGFLRDWLYVSGVLKSNRNSSNPANAWHCGLVSRWLPVGLRLVVLAIQAGWLWTNGLPGILPGISEGLPLAEQSLVVIFTVILNLLAAVLLILGIAPRLGAILGLAALGFYQILAPLELVQVTLAVAYTMILYIGSGALSVWQPEDYLFYHRAGEKHLRRSLPPVGAEQGT